ncbi:MAG: hypothetical protein ACTILK_05940 [Bifidobacterium crudilactis]|jgi:hypothetical protein
MMHNPEQATTVAADIGPESPSLTINAKAALATLASQARRNTHNG